MNKFTNKQENQIYTKAVRLIEEDANEEFLDMVSDTSKTEYEWMKHCQYSFFWTDEKVHPNDDVNTSQSSNDVVLSDKCSRNDPPKESYYQRSTTSSPHWVTRVIACKTSLRRTNTSHGRHAYHIGSRS